MNRKMVFYMIGKIVQAEAAMLLLPLVVALLYKENAAALSHYHRHSPGTGYRPVADL